MLDLYYTLYKLICHISLVFFVPSPFVLFYFFYLTFLIFLNFFWLILVLPYRLVMPPNIQLNEGGAGGILGKTVTEHWENIFTVMLSVVFRHS